MKLVYAIVHDEDSERATKKLNEKKFSVTKLSSTGGFLREEYDVDDRYGNQESSGSDPDERGVCKETAD